jgi:hypothetical protein
MQAECHILRESRPEAMVEISARKDERDVWQSKICMVQVGF